MQFRLDAHRTTLAPSTSSTIRSKRPFQMHAAAALALAAVCGVTGCQRGHSPDTLAIVNGKPILRPDVETRYQDTLGQSNQHPSREQGDIIRLNVVRDLIDEEILMQRAAKLNLVATDEEVMSKINEFKAPFTQEEFNKRLQDRHLTLDDLKREIRRGKTEEKLFNKEINSKINITDTDIANYYNAHKAEFNLIEPQYHLAQIVVTSVAAPAQQAGNLQNSKAANDTDAKKKIDTLHNRIESGEDFGMLAANFSERPDNAQSGGDMGFVSESQLHSDPEIYNAVGKLKPGQVTDVLPLYEGTPAGKKAVGYAIYKLVDKQAAGQRELNDPRVQQAIRSQLRDARSQLLKNAYIEMLRDQARVENYFAEEIFKNGAQ
ncbi:peptidyl-prolyl cis-trans isomerase SurA [Silvibacterium bohemicum]|uniref:peptidylprolyl isomerase n=1 Tax=Silvibacterium bohemicum TaxID=1577686 RepID=A0A841JXW8_9BACT|nr:SurA N-terminal domain-containing protein [Silvibacterium bohemicum]MBB6145455.1 peptidyl-prolyl cis-trans isomerase SurA [Silvibacterium bohemicum]